MKNRLYICHTYYHVFVTVMKELNIKNICEKNGDVYSCGATLILSSMSNDFGNLKERCDASELFEAVYMFDEKEDVTSDKVMKYHRDRGNTVLNLLQRIKYTRELGRLQEEYMPVDVSDYKDIYVYCDSDPIGYYLSYKHIRYHAIEDGLDCISAYDTARFSNRGHFALKAWMAKRGLLFIENGYGKYCIDMEVNDIGAIQYPTSNMIQVNRERLFAGVSESDYQAIVNIFMENADELLRIIRESEGRPSMMVLSEPLCDLDTRKKIFSDIIDIYGKGCVVYIKPHPRDSLDYTKEFPDAVVISGRFPMEVMNYIPGLKVDKLVSVFTMVKNISFADECVFLGEDFMDNYEEPAIHRQNEQI